MSILRVIAGKVVAERGRRETRRVDFGRRRPADPGVVVLGSGGGRGAGERTVAVGVVSGLAVVVVVVVVVLVVIGGKCIFVLQSVPAAQYSPPPPN